MDTVPTTPDVISDAEKLQPSPLPSLKATEGTAEATTGAVKQYIRTFHGDVETVKKGGTPDLVPLGDESRTTLEKAVVPQPIPPTPVPIPVAPEVPVPSPAEQSLPISEPLQTAATAPGERFVLQNLVAEEPPRPAEAFDEGGKPSPIETYAGDFTERMNTMQASTATVLAAEQDSAPMLVQARPSKFSRSSILYSIAGGILIIASGVGAYIAYTRYIASSAPVVLAPGAAAPIFVDDRKPVGGIGTALLQAIQQSVASQLASGSVRLLYLETATSTSVFSALQLPAPGVLLRNINAAQSMAGVVNTDGVQSPFFILSVSSYSNTFAGMLLWEKSMSRDLAKLYPPYPSPVVAESIATSTVATASTTPTVSTSSPRVSSSSPQVTTPSVPASKLVPPASAAVPAFFDATVANHDVRVYRDSAGRDVVLYGYWNQTTLVITRNAAAFSEIIGRLATSRTP